MSAKVNICMCVKNRPSTVRSSIDTILKQTFEDYVLLLCDDMSSDMTMNTLLEYQARYPGKVQAWQNPEEGYINVHNFILSKTDAEYICFIDSDDFVDERKLEEQVKFLDEHPDVDVVSTCTMFPNKQVLINSAVELDNDTITKALQNKIPISTICHFGSVMFRRKCLEKFTGNIYFYDEYNTGRCGDGFLYTLHFLGYKFANIISTIYVYSKGLIKNSLTNTVDPEFANSMDLLDYENKKMFTLEMFNNYNPQKKKRGRPKKSTI